MTTGPINNTFFILGPGYTQTGGGPQIMTMGNARYATFRRGISVNNPKSPIDGFRSPSPWNMVFAEGDTVPVGSWSYKHLGTTDVLRHGCLHGLPATPITSSLAPDWLKRQAELACINKVRDTKVELGATFAERVQTAGMFEEACGRIRDGFRKFRKGRRRPLSLVKTGTQMANDWLAWTFGWKPIVKDIYKAVKALNDRDNADQYRTWIKTRVTIPHTETTVREAYRGGGIVMVNKEVIESKVQVVFYYMIDPSQDPYRKLDEWGVLNPASVAWEVLPASFIADWALPVGDYISALTATVGYTFRAGARTEFVTMSSSDSYSGIPDYVLQSSSISASANWVSKRMVRSVYHDFPSPELRGVLDLKSTPSAEIIANRVASGMSLLVQAFT